MSNHRRSDKKAHASPPDDANDASRAYAAQQTLLAQLLEQQRCAKRLVPQSGNVPGQPTC